IGSRVPLLTSTQESARIFLQAPRFFGNLGPGSRAASTLPSFPDPDELGRDLPPPGVRRALGRALRLPLRRHGRDQVGRRRRRRRLPLEPLPEGPPLGAPRLRHRALLLGEAQELSRLAN